MQRNQFQYYYVQDNFGAFTYGNNSESYQQNNPPNHTPLKQDEIGNQVAKIILQNPDDSWVNLPTTIWPYSCIGLLYIQFEGHTELAMACLVSQNMALTCAHITHQNGIQAKSIHMLLGVNNQYGRSYRVKKIHIPNQYKTGQKLWDIALLELEGTPGVEYGYLAIGLQQTQSVQLRETELTMLTYNTPKDALDHKVLVQLVNAYNWKTLPGAPVLHKHQYGNKVVAVYVGGTQRIQFLDETYRNWFNGFIQVQKGEIDLSYKKIGDEGLGTLVEQKWSRLLKLNLRGCDISNQGADALSNLNAQKLTDLILSQNNIKNGIKALTRANIPNLTLLDLSGNQIGDEGLLYLVRSNWPKLQSLFLCRNHITNQGKTYLNRCNWPKMFSINLQLNHINKNDSFSYLLLPWSKPVRLYTPQPIRPVSLRIALELKLHAKESLCNWRDI